MSGPIVFISHDRVEDGTLDGFRRLFGEGYEVDADVGGNLRELSA